MTMKQCSASVLVTYSPGTLPDIQSASMELESFGELARLDASLSAVAGCVIATYFDVRSAERLLAEYQGLSESFPPAAHDNRVVTVNRMSFGEVIACMGGMGACGEVRDISTVDADVVVEFFDVRAAQQFATAVEGFGIQANIASAAANLRKPSLPAVQLGTKGGANCVGEPLLDTLKAMLAENGLPRDDCDGLAGDFGTTHAPISKVAAKVPKAKAKAQALHTMQAPHAEAKTAGTAPRAKRVKDKDVSRFDICPQMISEGKDHRTTVMVRNLLGPTARQWFFDLLAYCGLEESYTFFYMPLKEHRNVHSGFAFVNFCTPMDVLSLYSVMKSSGGKPLPLDGAPSNPNKVPAVSYARFQGHDELASHFQTSAVIHDQDPSKRPIFCRRKVPPLANGLAHGKAPGNVSSPHVDDAKTIPTASLYGDCGKQHGGPNGCLQAAHDDTLRQPAYVRIPGPPGPTQRAPQRKEDLMSPMMAFPFGPRASPEAGDDIFGSQHFVGA